MEEPTTQERGDRRTSNHLLKSETWLELKADNRHKREKMIWILYLDWIMEVTAMPIALNLPLFPWIVFVSLVMGIFLCMDLSSNFPKIMLPCVSAYLFCR